MNGITLLVVLGIGGLALLVGRLVGAWIDRQEHASRQDQEKQE